MERFEKATTSNLREDTIFWGTQQAGVSSSLARGLMPSAGEPEGELGGAEGPTNPHDEDMQLVDFEISEEKKSLLRVIERVTLPRKRRILPDFRIFLT